jgi:thiol:disulfide interchange protein DsbD
MIPRLWHLINVRRIAAILSIGLCLAAFTARAAHTQVQLILSADTVKPGDTILVGVDLKMEPGWHTYWKNPGDAGMATEIKWQLPPGISAGEIQWPLPEKLPPAEVTTYGYTNEVVLLVPFTLASNLPAGPVDLKANVSWLECKDSCIPAKADVQATLNVGGETKTSADAATIESWKSKVPSTLIASGGLGYTNYGWWEKPATGDTRPLMIDHQFLGDVAASVQFDNADFFPNASDQFEVQPTAEKITASSSEVKLRLFVKKFSGDWPKEISGVIVTSVRNYPPSGIEVKFPVTDESPAGKIISSVTNQSPALPSQPLWQMLIYAFIGGLILNIMPCVLPVIALKILGFVSEARSSPGRVRALGSVYAIGVLMSFLVLATIVIGVKAAGHQAGWGMQFGSPIFIVCLTTLVTLVALNLFGVFEVTLGGRTLDAAGNLASRHGAAGAFFNGVLATTLATPCTAPFLSIALGFAFAQSTSVIVLIFLTVGLGLSAPYVLLSWNPAWLKFLPKPGAWMEKFKIAMGFPMLATAVWLFNLACDDYGKNVLWLGIFLVIVAFAAWIFGEFVQRGRSFKTVFLAAIATLILLVGSYVFALEKELDWRTAIPETDSTGSLKESADGIDWQRWSPEAVALSRANGKPVLVDFTADWCLTCQVNKKTSIEISSVRKKLKDINAVALVGDYTHFPDGITAELNRYNRAGVPLVLVYPKNPDAQPIVLQEVLTPGIVLDALDRAAR